MPKSRDDVDRVALKAYALEHGFAAAAKQFKIPVATVKTWSSRDPAGPWGKRANEKAAKTSLQIAMGKAAEVMARERRQQQDELDGQAGVATGLDEIGERARMDLAQGLAKGAEVIKKMDGKKVLAGVREVKTLATALDLTHGWRGRKRVAKAGKPGWWENRLVNLEILDLVAEPLPSAGEEGVEANRDGGA